MQIKARYVYREVDRHGKERFYYREKGRGPRIPLPHPSSPDFSKAYAAAIAGRVKPRRLGRPAAVNPLRPKAGTLRWLCATYFASPEFRQLAASTQRTRRRIVEHCLREPIAPGAAEVFADCPLDMLTPKAIRVLRDRKADLPQAANGRVKVLRAIFKWGIEAEPDHVKGNPARDVSFLRGRAGGYHSWTIEEVEQYEARHPIGTQARLALALLLYTGQRRSDVVRFGEPMVRDGWLHFRQWKNRNRKPVDMELPILPALRDIIRATSPIGTQTWLVTSFGKPFTIAGFGNWFRDRCNEAGLPHCSAHGCARRQRRVWPNLAVQIAR